MKPRSAYLDCFGVYFMMWNCPSALFDSTYSWLWQRSPYIGPAGTIEVPLSWLKMVSSEPYLSPSTRTPVNRSLVPSTELIFNSLRVLSSSPNGWDDDEEEDISWMGIWVGALTPILVTLSPTSSSLVSWDDGGVWLMWKEEVEDGWTTEEDSPSWSSLKVRRELSS